MPALWPLVGALFGFLLWNWSPAKVFMGDVGSTFLGAVFAGVVLQQASFTAALGPLLVATPLLADACICVLRRLRAGATLAWPVVISLPRQCLLLPFCGVASRS